MTQYLETGDRPARGSDAASPTERHRDVSRDTASRETSPPTSIKAFAAARRRERAASLTDSDSESDTASLRRIQSPAKVSYMSNKLPSIRDRAASVVTRDDEQDDARHSPEPQGKQHLYIDFDFLENFIHANPRTLIPGDGAPPQASRASASAKGGQQDQGSSSPVAEGRPNLFKANRFSFMSSSLDAAIHAPELADLVQPGEQIRSLFAIPEDEDGTWWLDCLNATTDEVQNICTAFGIHPLLIEDIVTRDSREKVEIFSSYYLMSFESFYTVPEKDGGVEYEPFNVYIIVFRQGILSFCFAPNTHTSYVRQRITALKEHVSLSSDWICYALIDNIVDEFGPVIRQIEHDVDTIEDEVFIMRDFDSTSFLLRIGQVRNNINSLLRLLNGKADVLRSFAKRCNENYISTPRIDIGMYLDDIQDHVTTMVANLGHFENILSRAHSNYLASSSVTSLHQAAVTNDALGKISAIAAIFVPLHLVSTIWGMNVPVPFQNGVIDASNLAPFFGIIGSMATLGVIVLACARRQRWI